jgi:uncharacterized protein
VTGGAALGLVLTTVLALANPVAAQSEAGTERAIDTGGRTSADPRLLEAIDSYTGVAGRVDDDRARALLEEAARDAEDALAQMWMSRVYSRGRMGFERDEVRARLIARQVLPAVRTMAVAGDVEALFLMGTAYAEGLGVRADDDEALDWYGLAADQGHVLAAHNIGNAFRDGRGVDVNHETAAAWWLRAAKAGDVIPALRLGEAYEAGRGVEPDLDSARFWYAKAAAGGNVAAAEALERLGSEALPRAPAPISPLAPDPHPHPAH